MTTVLSGYRFSNLGITNAETTAPDPNIPNIAPYPAADMPSWSRAITGSSAHSALAQMLKTSVRTISARMALVWRANRSPLLTPASRVSGTPSGERGGRRQPRIPMIISEKKAPLASSALPLP